MRKNYLIKLWLGTSVLMLCAACGSPVYVATEIDAQVVDADTGIPIQGANVVANWELERLSLDSSSAVGVLKVMEAVTDSDGRFHFDGFIGLNFPNKGLGDADPRINIFKSGYQFERIENSYPEAGTKTPWLVRKSYADKKVIKLSKINLQEEIRKQGGGITLYFGYYSDLKLVTTFAENCEWKHIPKMILSMDKEKSRLKQMYPNAYIGLISISQVENQPGCGSATSFFNGK